MTGIIFSELEQLERIIEKLGDRAQIQIIERIQYNNLEFPIHCITLGSTEPDVPVLAFFGGVHGLEKIGSEVILSYMQTLCELLDWDEEFQARLEKSRLVFVPIVNPVGVYLGTRSNGNGVDLMRNSPVEGIGVTKLYGGHRISPLLPWYRGDKLNMEVEALVLCKIVRDQVFNSPFSIALDLHSGFG
jgi:Zinc carboxypeptidase